MKRRKFLSVCAICLLLVTCFPVMSAAAAQDTYQTIPVALEGKAIINGEAYLIDSITYVPLRKLSEAALDCDITWNDATKTATVKYGSVTVTARVGAKYIIANGRYFFTVGKIINLNGSLYVPVRPLARALGLEVEWNDKTRSVNLAYSGSPLISGGSFYKSDEVYWLSRIIEAEAGGEPFEGKIAVGNVVLNRVASKQYPNTIYQVIFDFKHGIQFTPAYTGTIYNTPSSESVIAAKVCLDGYEIAPGVLFFFNPRIATSSWISKNRPYAMTIGNHDFYY